MSSPEARAVVDTVVLRYFLLVERFDLLTTAMGSPLAVPRIVFDPDDADTPDSARSELSRSVSYHEDRAADWRFAEGDRAAAKIAAARLMHAATLHRSGVITVVDMSAEELALFGRLTNPASAGELGLVLPLDPGEAACVAVAVHRELVLATDDGDALRALQHIAPDHPTQRIRRILLQLVGQGELELAEAQGLHHEMRQLGFWDRPWTEPV